MPAGKKSVENRLHLFRIFFLLQAGQGLRKITNFGKKILNNYFDSFKQTVNNPRTPPDVNDSQRGLIKYYYYDG